MDRQEVIERLREAFNKDGVSDRALVECAEHGSDGGSGLVYYSETVEFHDKNEDDIWDLIEDDRESFGESDDILSFIASWNGAKNVGSMDQFKNLLVWYAQEVIGHHLIDEKVEIDEDE